MPDLQHDLVQDRERWYASRPDYIERMTGRSSKYLFHIVEELERRNMPTELALLPYIESAFNPQAVSSARAAGMWQFMPATGTYFDLKQNAFRDDRRDVLASTRAALDYLQKLYGMFGDWHLALAAYNWGEGSVGRAIARNQKAGLPTGYTDLNMPAETRLYVPKLQAVKNIVAKPDAFNVELPLIENHPYFQSVTIEHDIDVALVASLAGIKEADFRALNPSFNRPVILAAGTPQILLPWDNAKVFQRNLEAHKKGQYASWTVWAVPSTMGAAEAAKRVGMTESELRSVNNIPPRMLIKAGSALMVPRSGAMQANVSSHLADNGQLSLTPEIVTKRTTIKARKGDTVASLAKRHRVSAASIADWNDVKVNAAFKAGQQVVLHLPVRATRAQRNTARTHKSVASSSRKQVTTASRGGTPSRVKRR
jgi:membrane-bound lytic murein transglycosylase D